MKFDSGGSLGTTAKENNTATNDDDDASSSSSSSNNMELIPEIPFQINLSHHEITENISFHYGVNYETGPNAGDGTIPLISLGYMSALPWRTAQYNPAGKLLIS